MMPSGQAGVVAGAWAVAGIAASVWPALRGGWLAAGAAAALVMLLDFVWAWWRGLPEIVRQVPARFAVGQPGEVRMTVTNGGAGVVRLRWFDGIPAGSAAPGMPAEESVPGRKRLVTTHEVTIFRRGMAEFTPVHVAMRSPAGFWWRRFRAGGVERTRVYPDYAPVVRLALMAMADRMDRMGIVKRSQAGVSREFHQLREFREGDSLAQVDWKSTSRHRQLISRDFEEQRNQTVVFLLDTGRRMRAMDGKLPQFDHCLNAALLGAHVALRQGDLAGVQGFGGGDRWLPPLRGVHSMPVLLNHLYDYQTTADPSDFAEAVERLMARQKRRALVVLLTNLRGEDTGELLPALRLLRTRHLPLVASLREQATEDLRDGPVDSFRGALLYGATEAYIAERRRALREIAAEGVITVDATAAELPVALANRYLEIKRAARL